MDWFKRWHYTGHAPVTQESGFRTSGLTWNVDERMNFGYDALNRLTSTTPDSAATAAGANTYSYGANGNMLTRTEGGVTCIQTWDAENRLQTVNGQTTTYVYDGDGRRVKKIQGGQTTVYIGNYYEQNLSTGAVTTYYYAGGQRVAQRQGGTVYYFTGDNLGSTSLLYWLDENETFPLVFIHALTVLTCRA